MREETWVASSRWVRMRSKQSRWLSPLPFTASITREVFVSSNGRLTFQPVDPTGVPDLAAFLAAPQIAGLFADLDPTATPAASVIVDDRFPDQLVVTWFQVPAVGSTESNQVRLSLNSFDSSIVIAYGDLAIQTAIVGVSPGNPALHTQLDLSTGGAPVGSVDEAIAEQFTKNGDAVDLDQSTIVFFPQ